MPFVPSAPALAPNGQNVFDGRFGNWISSPAGNAPVNPNGPALSAVNAPSGIVGGKPMPDFPVPPPIWAPPNDPVSSDGDDWFARLFKLTR